MHSSLRFLLVCAVVARGAIAQDIINLDNGVVGTYLSLKRLRTTGSVLHVVAHPDDEDGAVLAYCARGAGVRTMLFSITRGEGGANLISDDFLDALGVLRTLEHQHAARYYGNEIFYSRGVDYGYSKTLAEAEQQWRNGEPILADLVEVIRRERPTLILSRFRGDSRDGHGHHQMAGKLSQLAFEAAADPAKFPEQLQRGLEPWQATKLYVNVRSRRRAPERSQWTVAIPTGQYDPLIGRSYAQIARFGLGFQRSQGISGHEGDPGPRTSYYRLEKHFGVATPADKEQSLFESIDTSLAGLIPVSDDAVQQEARATLRSIDERLDKIWTQWNPRESTSIAPLLADQLARLRSIDYVAGTETDRSDPLPAQLHRQLAHKDRQFQQAIVAAAGLQLDCWATGRDEAAFNHAVPGSTVLVHARIANQSEDVPVSLIRLQASTVEQTLLTQQDRIAPRAVFATDFEVTLDGVRPTRPYWSRTSIADALYSVSTGGQQMPLPVNPLAVTATMLVADQPINLSATVHVKQRHPEFGRVSYPLTVLPAMGVRFASTDGVIPLASTAYEVPVVVRSAVSGPAEARVRLEVPRGWLCAPASHSVSFQREDDEAVVRFSVTPPHSATARTYQFAASVSYQGREYREGFQTITARGLGRANLFRPATHRVRTADLQIRGTPRVGYIAGSGDRVAAALSVLDVHPLMLGPADLAAADLTRYDVILVGVRAYAVREDLRKHNARLLAYAKQGGVLIVQYQTPEFDQNFGPYPYQMGRRPEEVSQEDAVVTILQPNHVLFQRPNKITPDDFAGWFEQRGSKFWRTWDDKYTPLLECHDTGQAPQRGGMLVTRYGKGVYIYSAYAWYRQLPHGVTGAYRLFANMLSLPETMKP